MRNIFLALILLFFNAGLVRAETTNEKPLFVTITAKWCTTCQSLKPSLEELEYLYNEKIRFLTLDISSKESLETSKQKAEEAGITEFFNKNISNLPTVGIFCNNTVNPDKTLAGESKREIYEKALEVCSL